MNEYTDQREAAYAAIESMSNTQREALLYTLIYSMMGDLPADIDQLRELFREETGPAHTYGEYCECEECTA